MALMTFRPKIHYKYQTDLHLHVKHKLFQFKKIHTTKLIVLIPFTLSRSSVILSCKNVSDYFHTGHAAKQSINLNLCFRVFLFYAIFLISTVCLILLHSQSLNSPPRIMQIFKFVTFHKKENLQNAENICGLETIRNVILSIKIIKFY